SAGHSTGGSRAGSNPLPIENQFLVEIRPLVVATIQRLPQRTIESILPISGTVSPCAARQTPLWPSSTTVPPPTPRIVPPSVRVRRRPRTRHGPRRCRCDAVRRQWIFVGAGARELRAARALVPAVQAARAGTGRLGGAGDLLTGLARTTWSTRLLDERRSRRGREETRRARASDPSHAERHGERAGHERGMQPWGARGRGRDLERAPSRRPDLARA